ncbi:MAG: hypothetical protein B7Y80_01640 [Hyphomicrobium sp. 32-62-53]|nr:MAG: hypothetical protein B7Z29_01990 [Hyphomicrobium sp. 12-62-95]OYY01457.1 MAG: hypothetical protein B7Y80_01640 [Hyphomicrobium sp. 32-62-53]
MIGPCELAELEIPPAIYRIKADAWPRHKDDALRRIGMAAIVLVGYDRPHSITTFDPDGTVKSRVGHNRACWPFTFARTQSRKDTVTQNLAKGAHPELKAHGMFRLWCISVEHRDRLAEAYVDFLAAESEAHGGLAVLEPNWKDLGPNLNLDNFAQQLVTIAGRVGIQVWEEFELSRFVDKVMRYADEIRLSPKAPRDDGKVFDLAVARAMGI